MSRPPLGPMARYSLLGAIAVAPILAAQTPSIPVLETQVPAETIRQRVDAYFTPLVAGGLFSGTVLVARGGEVLVEKAYGLADIEKGIANTKDTQFKLMSVSKSITAIGVMRLVQDGKLALDDRVGKHLPSWPENWAAVTVHDLLDHTSGIANLCPVVWSRVHFQKHLCGLPLWREVAPQVANYELLAPPGQQHRYSNFNYELAGCVLEAVSGKSFREYVTANVLEPANMSRTGFDDGSRRDGLSIGYFREHGKPDRSEQDMSAIQAAGGFYSTVGDLYRLDRALYGDAVLNAESRATMFTPKTRDYACGWFVRSVHGHSCRHHSGGANGYVADFLRFVDDDACVAVQSNFAFAPITRCSQDTAAILFGADYAQPAKVDAATFDALLGNYRADNLPNTIIVRRSGDLLMMFDVYPGNERQGSRALIPLADGAFALAMGTTRLRFAKRGIDYMAPGGTTHMPRVDSGAGAWRKVVGSYDAQPPLGNGVHVELDKTRLTMFIEGRGQGIALLPVTETEAIALYGEGGGTMLRRDGNTLRYHNPSGQNFVLERR